MKKGARVRVTLILENIHLMSKRLSDSEDDQCDQEKATATNHNDSRSLRDHLGMVCSLIEVNSTGKREERSTVSESMWERNFRFSSKETASAECKPAQIFDYADAKKREKRVRNSCSGIGRCALLDFCYRVFKSPLVGKKMSSSFV